MKDGWPAMAMPGARSLLRDDEFAVGAGERPPRAVPAAGETAHMAAARELLASFHDRLSAWRDGDGPELDLTHCEPGSVHVASQMLGAGEISIRIRGPRTVHIHETSFPGLWRVQECDESDRVVRDRLVACPIPAVVVQAARGATAARVGAAAAPRGGTRATTLLRQILQQSATRRNGNRAHVVNLTLLPLGPEDRCVLDEVLGAGPVAIDSRGFGCCRASSTTARDVWRVQYFNGARMLILDTLEVVEVPEVALAAPEALAGSRVRLGELVDWMVEAGTA